MEHSKSQAAFAEAKQYIPGGVNSPVRSFRSVGGIPPIIAKGGGSKLTDIDGNRIYRLCAFLWTAAFRPRPSPGYRSHPAGSSQGFFLRCTDTGRDRIG